jgi:hypothetical protein
LKKFAGPLAANRKKQRRERLKKSGIDYDERYIWG